MPGRSIEAIIVLGVIPRVLARVKMHLRRALLGARGEPHASVADKDPMNDPEVPVLDVGVFKELHATLGSNTERVRTVYTKFLDTAARRVDELRHQPISASLKTLHALKGSAGMVGASRLAALAARLQEATTDSQTLAIAIPHIESELTTFHGVLNAQLESVSGAR
jgi:HPt (histidine-containing phosphotransfer) domain-containing protein